MDSIADSKGTSLSKLQEIVKDKESIWRAAVPEVRESDVT